MTSRHVARRIPPLLRIGGILFADLCIVLLFLYFLPARNDAYPPSYESVVQGAVQNQQKVITGITDLYKKGKYSFDQPLILQNPYGTAPLTALLIFDSSTPTQISIHIPGKTVQANVDYTFTGYLQYHEIPIYGLYADMVNHVTLTSQDKNGNQLQKVIDLKTEPIPQYLTSVMVVTSNPAAYSPGMNFTCLPFREIFDLNGDIRWYSTKISAQVLTPLSNGHYLVSYPTENDLGFLMLDNVGFVAMEEDLLGKIYAVYQVANGIQHDMVEMPNGNLLVTTQDYQAATTEDIMDEVDAQTGLVDQRSDLKSYLDASRLYGMLQPTDDWMHLNSIAYDASDSSVVLSSRSQSAVIKFSYPSMQIQWILGPHDDWTAAYQKYLLTPVGDNFEWSWAQHDASILSDEIVDGDKVTNILLFDNGLTRSFDPTVSLTSADAYSRIVLYQVDETKMTIRQVWEYGKERGDQLYSVSRGSAALLSNGDYLGNWAEILKDVEDDTVFQVSESQTSYSEVVEVNPTNNQVIFEAKIDSPNYRIYRAGLYDGYSAANSELSIKLVDASGLGYREQFLYSLQPSKNMLSWYTENAKMSVKHFLQEEGIWDHIK